MEGGGAEEVGGGDPHVVRKFRFHRASGDGPHLGEAGEVGALEPLGRGGEDVEAGLNVVENVDDEMVLRPCCTRERGGGGWGEQDVEVAAACAEIFPADRDQATGGVRERVLPSRAGWDVPILAEFYHEPVPVPPGLGRSGHVDLREFLTLEEENLRIVKSA